MIDDGHDLESETMIVSFAGHAPIGGQEMATHVNTLNAFPFRGVPRGRLMLKGIAMSREDGEERWTLTFGRKRLDWNAAFRLKMAWIGHEPPTGSPFDYSDFRRLVPPTL